MMVAMCVRFATENVLLHILILSGALACTYKNTPVFITAPQKMEALSGSCLQIPCNFRVNSGIKAESTSHVGVWVKTNPNVNKYPSNVIFNSSSQAKGYPMNLTGKLSEKNCTTLFSSLITTYTDTYYFRYENGTYKATAACDPLQITVKDSAPRPWINISGGVNDLKEKQSVTITCSAFTPCPHSPPKLTWTLQQDPHNIIEQNTDGTFRTKIQETITLSDTHDGLTISCSVGYPVNEGKDVKTAAAEITLSVSYAPKDTSVSVSPSGLVSAGSWVNLTCSSRAKPPVSRFTWFKNSKDGAISVDEGDFYSLNVTDGGDYYCVATNDLGSETSLVIHIEETPDGSLQQGRVLGGVIGFILLICLVVCGQRTEEMAVEEPTRKAEGEDEGIHYGEIDFSKRRPEQSSVSVQDSGQQQDTLYAEVKVSEKANSLTQPADSPDDLYAQVGKK
ncbi:B-cell receptor CD22-like [Centropristis striata]|uniref:B-cell receptor CD22-like n=1 Tax=Centropristis striata TaxID=184440 RepID=UPI0027DF9BC6|nr:B-cell receptor CD22-like [Centropristis striata]